MSEQNDTILNELEGANQVSEPKSDATNTEASQTEGDSSEELSLNELSPSDSTTPVKPSPEDYAKKAEESWANKIASGDKTLEELEEKQAWLAKRVKSRLGIEVPSEPKVDVRSEMERIKAEEKTKEDMAKYHELPVDQRREITKKVREWSSTGADAGKVLSKLMSEVSEKPTTHISSPTGGITPRTSNTITQEEYSSLSQAEFNRIDDLIDKGEMQVV